MYHPDLSGPKLHSLRCCEFGLLVTPRSLFSGSCSAENNQFTQHMLPSWETYTQRLVNEECEAQFSSLHCGAGMPWRAVPQLALGSAEASDSAALPFSSSQKPDPPSQFPQVLFPRTLPSKPTCVQILGHSPMTRDFLTMGWSVAHILNVHQHTTGDTSTTSSAGEKVCIGTFANTHGVNTPTMTQLKPSLRSH